MTRGGTKLESGLTVRQESFCNEYLIDLDEHKAALRAGYAEGRAARFGRELLRDSRIKERIQLLMDRRAQTTDVTPERVVMELARLGFSDIRNIVEITGGRVRLRDTSEMSDEAAASVKKASMTEREMDDGGVFRTYQIEMWDKPKALGELAKHTGVGVGERGVHDREEVKAEEVYKAAMDAVMDDIEKFREENEKALPEERLEPRDVKSE